MAESIPLSSILNILGLSIQDLSIPNLPEPIELPENFELEFIETEGQLVDADTLEPIPKVTVLSPLKIPVRTDNEGKFTIKVPNILESPFSPSKFQSNILGKRNKYSPKIITPYLSNREVKPSLGIIPLLPIESDLLQEITDLLTFQDAEVEEYATIDLSFEFFVEKRLNGSIDELKKLVIPLILGLIAQYGIAKVQEQLEKVKANGNKLTQELIQQITCPTSDAFDKILSTQNKLVYQLDKVLKSIKSANDVIQTTDNIIQTVDTVFQVLKVLPTPTAIGGVGIPISVVNTVQDVKNFLNNNIGKFKQGSSALATILGLLVKVLTQVLDFLKLLDLINQYCASQQNTEISTTGEDPVLTELSELSREQQQQQPIPPIDNLNGFTFDIETENTTADLKRRRAVAKNKQGTTLLKGEYSYSAIDKILIDELIFYIQTNDLKAD